MFVSNCFFLLLQYTTEHRGGGPEVFLVFFGSFPEALGGWLDVLEGAFGRPLA